MAAPQPSVGIALSGGGNRAACWAAGALLGLAESGMTKDVVSVASVSGGSLANGVVARAGDLRVAPRATLADWLAPGLQQWAHEGLFFPGPHTDGWVATTLGGVAAAVGGLAGGVAATVAAGRHPSGATTVLTGVAAGAALVGVTAFVGRKAIPAGTIRRSTVLGAASGGVAVAAGTALAGERPLALLGIWPIAGLGFLAAARRFGGRSQALVAAMEASGPYAGVTLASLADRPVHHLFCTTDLSTGDNLYLTNRLVWGSPDLRAKPGAISLASAVQASACLPGAFLARTIEELPCDPPAPRPVVLSDGGVYDNMADQWESGFAARLERFTKDGQADMLLSAQESPADQFVVVNASRGMDDLGTIRTEPGLGGELASAMGAKNVLYDVSTAPRRRRLVDAFDLAIESGETKGAGFLVHIGTSPYGVVDRYADRAGVRNAYAIAAREALDSLTDATWPDVAGDAGARRKRWRDLVGVNAGVATTLAPLEGLRIGCSADLVFHAFVLARIGAFVHLGRGTLPSSPGGWSRSSFVDLVANPN